MKLIEDLGMMTVRGVRRHMGKYECPSCSTIFERRMETQNDENSLCTKCMLVTRNKTHGQTKTRLFTIWQGVKSRTQNTKGREKMYPSYHRRNTTMCDEWSSFEVFALWANANGYSDDLTIDRIDNDGNYEPFNCQWITHRENARKDLVGKKLDRERVEKWRKAVTVWTKPVIENIMADMVDGVTVGSVLKKHNIPTKSFYVAKKRYGL